MPNSYKKLRRVVLTTLILSTLLVSTSACAVRPRPVPDVHVACAPLTYFVDVYKPVPKGDSFRDLEEWAVKISRSWDNLYIDRLKARTIIEEGLK
jgi:hypothetical protein